jgi:hypothetical protein
MPQKKTKYIDKKYNYPKGFVKYGKPKTGFMPSKLGAKLFVNKNFDEIKKGNIPFDKLTTREKKVYRGKFSTTFDNLFQFENKRYYDPTGTLKTILANKLPELKGKKNLTNFLPKKEFVEFFNFEYNPTKYADGANSTFFDFLKGKAKEYYRDQSGTLLDIATRLNKSRDSGRQIKVIGKDNEIFYGVKAIEKMREYEAQELETLTEQTPEGQPIQLQIVYLSNSFNPYTNTITYNLNNTQVNDLNSTP